ncbi:hypothetical protein Ddc_03020 [Ditylenchus destructor]|nr:hypothetical protein Ddc_03020 [Ditylenchus destructor]
MVVEGPRVRVENFRHYPKPKKYYSVFDDYDEVEKSGSWPVRKGFIASSSTGTLTPRVRLGYQQGLTKEHPPTLPTCIGRNSRRIGSGPVVASS